MNPIIEKSVTELAAAIADGQISAVEATQAYLDAIEAREPEIAAYNETCGDLAMQQAQAVDAKRQAGQTLGPLAGVPVAVKDNLCTEFGHTTCSSAYLKNFKAPYTATVVAKLQQAGAVILGKTNLDEFAMGSSTENSGFAPTKNPWDTSRVPGGSSGGSAAAVAGRLCAGSLGSDTGGSIRQPAGLCGVVGVKPTYGRVSRYGLVAFGSSLDQIGPLATNVTDAALLTSVIAGHDERDSTSLPNPVGDYLADIDTPIDGLRIGLPREFYTEALGGETREAIAAAIETYKATGAEIVDVSLPHSRIDIDAAGNISSFAVACYYIVCTAECSSNLARFDGVHYGHRTAEKVDDIIELFSRSRDESLGDEVKRRIMLGTYTLSSGYYDAYYNKALKVRRLIADDFTAAFEKCDVLLCPTTPTTAFKFGEKTDNPLEMYLSDIYTISLNLAGLPGISIPAGLSKDNLPIGMQLIGPVLSEKTLFRAGRMFELASGISRLAPPMLKA
ncbi:MAG: Asp-tRNA(Asn)/Glu-tRNA(Gln) amidotransferase subunit GatA [Phycisphaerae bacterium]|nr:Asp-tRNA(Asn)/Glu-tRNA(Gln) amidotransferase subunit GatA [Phycisphaerae bacterium]